MAKLNTKNKKTVDKYLMAVGTEVGRVLVYQWSYNNGTLKELLYRSKAGVAYGAITGV